MSRGRRIAGRGRAGFAMLELVVALMLALVVLLAMGRIIITNQTAWGLGRDRAVLQQNVTESVEWMVRSIREAHSLALVSAGEFRTYDANGALLHTYRRNTSVTPAVLQRDGGNLSDRECTQFAVSANADLTCLTIQLEMRNPVGERVATSVRATVRNAHLEF